MRIDYSANGGFRIYKIVDGSVTILQDWTPSPAIKTGPAWNVLWVAAVGPDLYYYINGALVWTGSDSSLTSGRVGVGMYTTGSELEPAGCGLGFTQLVGGSYQPESQISPEQQALNQAAFPGGNPENAP